MKYSPPGVGDIELDTIILDLNGTLSVNGQIVAGAIERINKLKEMGFKFYLFTGDARGDASLKAQEAGIEVVITKNTAEKFLAAQKINQDKTVAIGNARIDIGTFKNARLKIATLQKEGIHTGILNEIDILVPSINDALDLLLDPATFNATMRF